MTSIIDKKPELPRGWRVSSAQATYINTQRNAAQTAYDDGSHSMHDLVRFHAFKAMAEVIKLQEDIDKGK